MTDLYLQGNQIVVLQNEIFNLSSLASLNLSSNQLDILPDNIGNLINLCQLYLGNNKLNNLPLDISKLAMLTDLNLDYNPLTDLSNLQELPNLKTLGFLNIALPRRYWTKLSDWKPEWLLDEDNSAIRHILIEQIGYEKICQEIDVITVDNWKEYTLLKIEKVVEEIYDEDDEDEPICTEPIILLKMTCPSTQHIHILRVPPEMTSAEAAITWVNHGIHPDEFAVQT